MTAPTVDALGGTSWVDSHCHLPDAKIPGGVDGAIAAARAAGVAQMVSVGCDRDTSLAALEAADRFDDVFATVGLHPHDARLGVGTIADLVLRPDVVAIGECGLDYHYDHSPRDVQRSVFAEQIALAHQLSLPLVIHTRDAWEDTFAILDSEGMPADTVFHCFTGGAAEASMCLDRGALLSFSGIVTFKAAADVQAAAKLCPLDRMLVETDSPYLAPIPHRGKPNQPAFVALVGQAIAALRDIPTADVAAATSANAQRFFRLPHAHNLTRSRPAD